MHKVIGTPVISMDDMVESHRSPQNDQTANATDPAEAQSTRTRLGRQVNARDLHSGDIMRQYDWSLHVHDVQIDQAVVAVAVTEFGFHLHYGADEQVELQRHGPLSCVTTDCRGVPK